MEALDMQINLSKQLYQRRRWLNITQADLAEKTGLSQGTIYRIEANEGVGFHKVLKVAHALGCEIALINTHSHYTGLPSDSVEFTRPEEG